MAGFKVIGFARVFDGETSYVEIPKLWDEIKDRYADNVWKGNAPENAVEKAIWIPVKKK